MECTCIGKKIRKGLRWTHVFGNKGIMSFSVVFWNIGRERNGNGY